MEAGAKSDTLKESTAPCPADWSRGNKVGNKAHCNILRGLKIWYFYICHWSNFFLIFAHKRWFKDLNDFFSPLKIACQNNTCFWWPHGRHGNCANPSHWYHSPPSIYHVCVFKRLKKPSRFCDRIFFSFTSVLKIVGKLFNVYPFLEWQCKGKHHCCTPDSFTGLANPEPLQNRSDQELNAAPCFDSPGTKES